MDMFAYLDRLEMDLEASAELIRRLKEHHRLIEELRLDSGVGRKFEVFLIRQRTTDTLNKLLQLGRLVRLKPE